jgi:hypothetical protein
VEKVPFPRRAAVILVLCLLGAGTILVAQEPGETDAAAFFSGTVTALGEGKVSVSRTILGKSPETRTFILNEKTKIEGQLKMKSRVTVRFAPSDEGDMAVSIVVRDGTPHRTK